MVKQICTHLYVGFVPCKDKLSSIKVIIQVQDSTVVPPGKRQHILVAVPVWLNFAVVCMHRVTHIWSCLEPLLQPRNWLCSSRDKVCVGEIQRGLQTETSLDVRPHSLTRVKDQSSQSGVNSALLDKLRETVDNIGIKNPLIKLQRTYASLTKLFRLHACSTTAQTEKEQCELV